MGRPEFLIVLRGYDRAQVDQFLDAAESAATRPASPPSFRITLRGYDRRAVDKHITELLTSPSPD